MDVLHCPAELGGTARLLCDAKNRAVYRGHISGNGSKATRTSVIEKNIADSHGWFQDLNYGFHPMHASRGDRVFRISCRPVFASSMPEHECKAIVTATPGDFSDRVDRIAGFLHHVNSGQAPSCSGSQSTNTTLEAPVTPSLSRDDTGTAYRNPSLQGTCDFFHNMGPGDSRRADREVRRQRPIHLSVHVQLTKGGFWNPAAVLCSNKPDFLIETPIRELFHSSSRHCAWRRLHRRFRLGCSSAPCYRHCENYSEP